MFCRIFLYSNSSEESKKIVKKIFSNKDNLIKKMSIKNNQKYWKIDTMFVIECDIDLYGEENEVRESDKWNKFLNTISDNWCRLGNDNFLSSDTMEDIHYIMPKLAMITIFIGDDN